MSPNLSTTEENYLKAIYKLTEQKEEAKNFVNTNSIAKAMSTSAASVTDMIKRLEKKKMLDYQPYKGVKLNEEGKQISNTLIRKHRLWEVFLLEKLNFKWDEVHDIAEQLEHIQSDELTDRLDAFLGYPQYDPHGDPIPDKEGNVQFHLEFFLADLQTSEKGYVIGVRHHAPDFLRHLEEQSLILGTHVEVIKQFSYDNSIQVKLNEELITTVSNQVSSNLYIKKIN